jgi:hypothetical protein
MKKNDYFTALVSVPTLGIAFPRPDIPVPYVMIILSEREGLNKPETLRYSKKL